MHEEKWSNPTNWSGGILYFCEADPRLVVPKRRRAMGWTINFGHRLGWAMLATLIAVPIIAGATAFGAHA